MEKIFKYMEKTGIEHEKTTFGGSYFENAPKISFEAAYITLGRDGINTAAWQNLKRWCNRNNYDLRAWCGWPGRTVFSVCRTDDRKTLEIYCEYQRQSVTACEKQIHLRHEGFYSNETDREFNDRLTGIMEFYGEGLKKALEQSENITAA